jgi:hypothetical protein
MVYLARRLHLGWHDLIVLGLNFLSWTAGASLAVLQFPVESRSSGIYAGGVIMALAPSVVAIVTQISGNTKRSREELERRRKLATSIIEDLCRAVTKIMSACPDRTGVVVFLPTSSGVLQTTYTFNKNDRPDNDLQFEKHQGVVGDAWARGELMVGNLEEVTEQDLRQIWKLSPEYISRTSHLKTIVAVPIRSADDPEQIIGIVSIDSDLPNDQCGIASDESQDEALQFARMLAHIMKLADLV